MKKIHIIYESIKDVSNHNSDKLAKKCAKIIDKILQLCITKLSQNMNINKYHKLVWLRYGTGSPDDRTDDFDIPRWHCDGNYEINNISIVDPPANQKNNCVSDWTRNINCKM